MVHLFVLLLATARGGVAEGETSWRHDNTVETIREFGPTMQSHLHLARPRCSSLTHVLDRSASLDRLRRMWAYVPDIRLLSCSMASKHDIYLTCPARHLSRSPSN